jgi:hypothetical protein
VLIVYDKNFHHQLFLTCVFRECQLLCNARANNRHSHQFSSGNDLHLLKEFPLYCRLWDFGVPILGRILGSNETAALALRNSVQCANTQVYFAGDPESGGHPIGRRSIAPETGFRFRCRSWSSAR